MESGVVDDVGDKSPKRMDAPWPNSRNGGGLAAMRSTCTRNGVGIGKRKCVFRVQRMGWSWSYCVVYSTEADRKT